MSYILFGNVQLFGDVRETFESLDEVCDRVVEIFTAKSPTNPKFNAQYSACLWIRDDAQTFLLHWDMFMRSHWKNPENPRTCPVSKEFNDMYRVKYEAKLASVQHQA